MGSVKGTVLVLVLVAPVSLGWSLSQGQSAPQAEVMLEVEMFGGFAYIKEAGRLHVAYLKDVTSAPASSGGGCNVHQLGTDLKLISGEIVSPLPPDPDRMWDLENAIVTFPGLATPGPVLDAPDGHRPVNGPSNPDDDTLWAEDLRFVPRITTGTAGSDYPNHRKSKNWRQKVNGYIEIPRGVVRGSHPSDHDLRRTLFEFKTRNSATGATPFVHALTDRVIWRVPVRGDRIQISLKGASKAPHEIVIRPTRGNRVQLKLIGRHTHGTPASLEVGTELDHFCAFYELLERQSASPASPAFVDRLTPYVFQIPPPVTTSAGTGQPSPGPLCPGIGFAP
jgi:hypothetical protein